MLKDHDLQEEVVGLRRRFHQIPEVGLLLPKTRALIIAELEKMSIEYVCSQKSSGLVAGVKGKGKGRTIALRADMDALPITEATGLPFSSQHEGQMHACGHDCHLAMLLAAAKILNTNKDSFGGTVKFVFQAGEETAEGARIMIDEGLLAGVEQIFAIHIGTLWGTQYPAGTMVIVSGCCKASYDKFTITVYGSGCHGSTPEKGVDPIVISAQLVLALQELIAREISAVKPAVVTIGQIHGGNQYNIIPDQVVIEGTIRALSEEVRQYAARRIREIAESIGKVFRGSCRAEMIWGAPPVINDAALAQKAVRAAISALGSDKVITSVSAPSMSGDDFSCFLQQADGVYMFFSSVNAAKGCDYPHHNAKFNVDEDVLAQGAAFWVELVKELLPLGE